MTTDPEVTRLRRVIADAVWQLEHDYQLGALAVLRGAREQQHRSVPPLPAHTAGKERP